MRVHKTSLLRFQCVLLEIVVAATLAGTGGQLSIKEGGTPTPNSRPHDPAVGPDGSLWYTGQRANKLGLLDPQTGQFNEYPLKTPGRDRMGWWRIAKGISDLARLLKVM
jgi:streptogramin lyase